MKALIFGQTGQVAKELSRQVPEGFEAQFLSRAEADLSEPSACAAAITSAKPDVVINAAAYTAVDKAEEDEPLAAMINGAAPTAMAEACAGLDIPLLHVSTDYVFDGSGETPWQEQAPTAPLGAYGWTKLAGEQGIMAAKGTYVILRTSWVFSSHGANFLKTMLRLSESRDKLTIVADQIGGPTPAAAIANALWQIAKAFDAGQGTSGIYHFSGAPDVSWADFAREIFDQAGREVAVEDIPSTAYPTPAARPKNSRLSCDRLAQDYGINRPDWHSGVAAALKDLNED